MRVRLLGLALTLAALLVVAEAGAWLAFLVVERKPFSYQRTAARRQERMQADAPPPLAAVEPPPPGAAAEGRPERTPAELVPHPFFGFTYNPENALLKSQQGRGALALTEHGFFELAAPPAHRRGPALRVALLGGSMAGYVCVDGREALDAALQGLPELRGRPLELRCFALGGFKQPQTAAALSYVSILGASFDIVIVLDGFNDVALPFGEHKFKGAFPAYPREWDQLVGGTPDREQQRRIGRLAYLEHVRAALARRFDRAPWSRSVAACLVWRALDAWLARRVGAARFEAARAAPERRTYATAGPRVSFADDDALLRHIAAVWERASLQMHRLTRAAGGRAFHFLQPNQYVAGSKPMGAAERRVAWRADHPYRIPVERGYPLLREAGRHLRREGAHFEDLTRLFENVAGPVYVDDCCHVSREGSAAIARAMGERIAAAWRQP